jgi:hypothetical protein
MWSRLATLAGLVCAMAAGGAASPARAQEAASTYTVGEHVEVKPTSRQNAWEDGVVVEVTADQVVVRSASAWRAFVLTDVRHRQGGGPAPQGGAEVYGRSYSTGPSAGSGARGGGSGAGQAASNRAAGASRAAAPAGQGGGRNGERVSVAVGGACCYDGTIIGTGSGSAAGMYLIHYDNPASQDAYAQPHFIFPRGTRNRNAAPAPDRPGTGHTRCVMSYGGPYPVCLPVAAPR